MKCQLMSDGSVPALATISCTWRPRIRRIGRTNNDTAPAYVVLAEVSVARIVGGLNEHAGLGLAHGHQSGLRITAKSSNCLRNLQSDESHLARQLQLRRQRRDARTNACQRSDHSLPSLHDCEKMTVIDSARGRLCRASWLYVPGIPDLR